MSERPVLFGGRGALPSCLPFTSHSDTLHAVTLSIALPEFHERRYLRTGNTAHVLYTVSELQPYASALCGRSPEWGSAWLGTGSQSEQDKAESLRLCRACFEVLAIRAYMASLYGKGGWSPGSVKHAPHEGRCKKDGHRWPCKGHQAEMRRAAKGA